MLKKVKDFFPGLANFCYGFGELKNVINGQYSSRRSSLHYRTPPNSQQSQSYDRQKLRKSLFQSGFQIYNSEILSFPQMNLIHFVGRPRFRCYKFEIHFGKVVFSTSNGCNFATIGSQKASDSANSICVSCTVDLSCFQDETNILDTTNLSDNFFCTFFNIQLDILDDLRSDNEV